MKLNKLILISLLLYLNTINNEGAPDFNKLADSINRAENSTKHPYGVKSINTYGNKLEARKICINTIKHNYAKWLQYKGNIDFIQFLGNVYAPCGVSNLNKNWVKNVTFYYNKL